MIASHQVMDEIRRNVWRKARHRTQDGGTFWRALGFLWLRIPTKRLVRSLAVTINAGDAPIVASAIEADVDYFVTGDRRLLTECRALGLDRPVFLSPRELVDRLGE